MVRSPVPAAISRTCAPGLMLLALTAYHLTIRCVPSDITSFMMSYLAETVSKTSATRSAFSSTLTLANPKCVVSSPSCAWRLLVLMRMSFRPMDWYKSYPSLPWVPCNLCRRGAPA